MRSNYPIVVSDMQGNIQSFFAKLKHKLSAGSNLAHTDLNAGCKITSSWQLVPAAYNPPKKIVLKTSK